MNAVDTSAAVAFDVGPAAVKAATRRQIRGSSLLLSGRLLSKAINFGVQIITVRYLSLTDFGAFAYALAIVQLGQSVATFGLDRATTRFLPMYHEQQDYGRFFGTLLMIAGTILALGTAIALSFPYVAPAFLDDDRTYALLLCLIFLVPIQAIDDLMVGLFAVFARPGAIFFRRHVLAPGLKLTVVLVLVFSHSSVFFLAWGYLLSSLFGASMYVLMLWRQVRAQGLFDHFSLAAVEVPWKPVLAFTVPLLVSDLVYVVMNSISVVLVEHSHGVAEVAPLRAQYHVAAMNQLVMASFATLFTPVAARMYARGDRDGVDTLYWQTAIWIAVCSFPVFVLTCSLAQPLTVMLLGERYEGSAGMLALLALGYYFNAALGFNGLVLKIQGKVGYVVVIGLVTIAVSLALNLALIPHYGAMGAAVGMAVAMICHNVLKQAGLLLGTGVRLFEWRYLRVYAVLVTAAVVLFLVQWLVAPSAPLTLVLAALATWVVFRATRTLLDLERTFPEILRIPLVRRVLGV